MAVSHADIALAMMPVFGPRDGLIGLKVQDPWLDGLAINQQIVITIENHLWISFDRVWIEEIANVGAAEAG